MANNKRKMIYEAFAQYYDQIYGEIEHPIEEHDSFKFVEWVLEKYATKSTSEILDIGSGTGRILLPLAEQGYKIKGLEPYDEMRKLTRLKAKHENIQVDVKSGKFQDLSEVNKYDLILSINGSFAYIHDTEASVISFENINRALKPGGIFVIDVLNFYGILGNYKHPELTDIEIDGFKGKSILKLDKDIDRSVWIHDMHLYLETNEGIEYYEDYHELALISPRELKLLAHYNEFELLHYFNSYTQPFDNESEGIRCIMIFQKKDQ